MQNLQNGLNVDDSLEPNSTPIIVVYVVDPFTYTDSSDGEMLRTSMIALYHCYQQMLKTLPTEIRHNIQLQVVPLDSILAVEQCCSPSKKIDQLMQMALAVYYQSGPTLPPAIPPGQVKSLTGMGPAASQDRFIKEKMRNLAAQSGNGHVHGQITPNGQPTNGQGSGAASSAAASPSSSSSSPLSSSSVSSENDVKTWNPPFILAPMKDKQTELGEMFGDHRERSSILYCSYCLSEDQRWLLASVTNEKGDLLRNASINIEVPNRTRRKKASARLVGLNKLMAFVLNVISNHDVRPWRLVIGRIGRIGHGELKEWAQLLSRKSLLRYSRYLREECQQCGVLTSPLDVPCILSACLVSLEADSCLQVFADQFTPEERISTNAQRCELSTPQDATCTHILVFPTSATTQCSQATFNHLGQDHGMDIGEDDEFFNTIRQDIDGGENFDDMIFNLDSSPEGVGGGGDDNATGRSKSPNNDPIMMGGIMLGGSTGGMLNGPPGSMAMGNNPTAVGGVNNPAGRSGHGEFLLGGEEPMQLLQQPLALGYFVSTAPAGNLPKWFWSSCPQLENANPVFLKVSSLRPRRNSNFSSIFSSIRLSVRPSDYRRHDCKSSDAAADYRYDI